MDDKDLRCECLRIAERLVTSGCRYQNRDVIEVAGELYAFVSGKQHPRT